MVTPQSMEGDFFDAIGNFNEKCKQLLCQSAQNWVRHKGIQANYLLVFVGNFSGFLVNFT
jgi:hypothetical protein